MKLVGSQGFDAVGGRRNSCDERKIIKCSISVNEVLKISERTFYPMMA